MKKMIGLVVILAALVLGGYYGMGIVTQHTLTNTVDVVNHSNGIFVDIGQYNRGWFSSNAILNWRFHIPERIIQGENGQSTTVPAEDFKIQMPLEIHHGPIIFAHSRLRFGLGYAYSELPIPEAYAQKFTNLLAAESTKPQINLSLFVSYLNSTNLHIDLPSFKLISKQGGDNFEWLGMNTSLSASSNLKKMDGSVVVTGANLTKNMMHATLGKVSSDYDLYLTDSGLYIGEANLALPSLVIMENKQKLFEIEGFDQHTKTDVEMGLFNLYIKTSFDKLTLQDKTYGPAYLDVSLKNIDAQVLADINQQANKIHQGTDSERQQALIAMLPELPKLFGKGAQLEVSKLSLVLPEGVIEGGLLLSLPKGDTGNPFQLVQKIQGHATLKVPTLVVSALLKANIKQKLLSQPTIQQAMIQQMKTNASATAVAPEAQPAATAATTSTPDVAGVVPVTAKPVVSQGAANAPSTLPQDGQDLNKPITVAEIEQQATAQTDLKLSELVKSGVLSLQGKEYVIELGLSQGQLSVNGKPFNSAMMQF